MNGPGRLVRARRDLDRAGSGEKRPTDPETQIVIPAVGGVPVAEGRAQVPRRADPVLRCAIFRWQPVETPGSETARVHLDARQRSDFALRSTSAAERSPAGYRS
jgi:hypothetical protein